MANKDHVAVLAEGVCAWNEWRKRNPGIKPDLSETLIRGPYARRLPDGSLERIGPETIVRVDGNLYSVPDTDFVGGDFSHCNFANAELDGIDLSRADFRHATMLRCGLTNLLLRHADLSGTNVADAFVFGCDAASARLVNADFTGTKLHDTDLRDCLIQGVDFTYATLINVDLRDASIEDCLVYGASAWDVDLRGTSQEGLCITRRLGGAFPPEVPDIEVDNLEVAQFIYLLLNNHKIRDVIDTITSKIVLILGRFGEHKPVLDAVRSALRNHGYVSVMFDFNQPSSRDTDETVSLLARMARFVVADITDARCVPQELKGFVETNPSVPVQPLLQASCEEFAMFEHYRRRYSWVLPTHRYESINDLVATLATHVIAPVEAHLTANPQYAHRPGGTLRL